MLISECKCRHYFIPAIALTNVNYFIIVVTFKSSIVNL
nr:MAG TPA: hypothetical protein [Caudoviricetes sp.]